MLPDLGQRRHQPERADRERAFLVGEPVIGIFDPVASHEAILQHVVALRFEEAVRLDVQHHIEVAGKATSGCWS